MTLSVSQPICMLCLVKVRLVVSESTTDRQTLHFIYVDCTFLLCWPASLTSLLINYGSKNQHQSWHSASFLGQARIYSWYQEIIENGFKTNVIFSDVKKTPKKTQSKSILDHGIQPILQSELNKLNLSLFLGSLN